MKNLLILTALIALPGALAAQDQAAPHDRANGHVTAGLGVCQHGVLLLGIDGGGEGFVYRGLALGGDIGAYSFTDTEPFGVATLGGNYHFVRRAAVGRFDPFIGAGYTMVFSPGWYHGSGASLGGGINYWFTNRIGLRLDARAYIIGETAVVSRFGIAFR